MISKKILEDIQKFGKKISLKITIDDEIYEKDDIISCTKSFNGDMLKSVMQYVDVELFGLIDVKDKEINIEFGVCVEEPYEYISWGSFIVDNETIEKSIDKNTTKFTAYDYLCKSCVDYADLGITYPITVKEYLNAICKHLGYTLQTQTFINDEKIIDEEKFLVESYTFRDALDHIAGATASVIVVKGNRLYVKYPTDIGITVDENNLKTMNLLEKFGPINSLVLSLQPQEDNYYMQDAESIEINGLTEIKISNNEILNKHREDFANEIFENLKGLYFYPFEIESFGFAVFEPYDLIHIKDTDGNIYQSVVLNDTITVTTGINEKFYTVRPEVTETDYSKATQDKKMLYRTLLEVDKNKQTIDIIAEQQENDEKRITDLQISLDGLKSTVTETVKNELGGREPENLLSNYQKEYTSVDDGVNAHRSMLIWKEHDFTPIFNTTVDEDTGKCPAYMLSFDAKIIPKEGETLPEGAYKVDLDNCDDEGTFNNGGYHFNQWKGTLYLTDEWARYTAEIRPELNAYANPIDPDNVNSTYLYFNCINLNYVEGATFSVRNVQLTEGEEPKEWFEPTDGIFVTYSEHKSSIEQLSDAISTLVVDENGQSLMHQTSKGWSFNIGGVTDQLNDAVDKLKAVEDDIENVNGLAENINELAEDLVKKTAYIRLEQDSTGKPCIILGKEDSSFQLRITNESIDFMEGSNGVAYVSNNRFYAPQIVAVNSIQVGEKPGFKFEMRENGNMALIPITS